MIHPTIHVYRSQNLPKGADTPTAKYVSYGARFTGLIARGAVIHDKPETQEEKDWISEHLAVRMGPGAEIIYLDGPSWDGPKTTTETTD